MKIISAEVRNFGSYKHLEFNFQNQGLALIAGPTGVGKSTLCDIIPWVLFGVTAKNGLADDVRSWNATEPTQGVISVSLSGKTVQVSRIRAPKLNDLYFEDDTGVKVRGKDLADTQRLINEALGFDANLYLSGAYFHEFSQAASFFTASAKVRRVVTEQLVDLSMAKQLTEKTNLARKTLKLRGAEIVDLRKETSIRLENAKVRCQAEQKYAANWVDSQEQRIAHAAAAHASFEDTKNKDLRSLLKQENELVFEREKTLIQYQNDIVELKTLLNEDLKPKQLLIDTQLASLGESKCGSCGALKHSTERLTLTKQKHDLAIKMSAQTNNKRAIANIDNMIRLETAKANPYTTSIIKLKQAVSAYESTIRTLKIETNPFVATLAQARLNKDSIAEDVETLNHLHDDWKQESQDMDFMSDVLDVFRTTLVQTAVSDLELRTNTMLTDHFDAELRVTFDAKDADKLEATISKDGNECSYAQLSKGQRQLLKLCFGIAIMQIVANHNAVNFDVIFLDEFVDGCDDQIKAKAFGLLQTLALNYNSVFAIDHSESLKAMFNARFDVTLINGTSQVEKAV